MTNKNQQDMDFDDDSRESAGVLQNSEEVNHSEPDAASSAELKTDVNENETENSLDTVKDCDQNRSEDDRGDCGESQATTRSDSLNKVYLQESGQGQAAQLPQGSAAQKDSDQNIAEYSSDDRNTNPAGESSARSRSPSPIDVDSQEPDQVVQGSATPEEMGGKASKKSKRQSRVDEFFRRDSSPDEPKAAKPPMLRKRWSDLDTEAYRQGYPDKQDDMTAKDNLLFYTNSLKSKPDGDFIDTIHKKWRGNYKLLESHHGYIQWLFPIRELGMNYLAQELQLHEAKAIKEDKEAMKRVLASYELMLDFYGMKLKDGTSGQIQRAEHWERRFNHLNRSKHNHLRITRILKSLGELGYEHFQYPFVEFVLKEALEERTLQDCIDSCRDYWIGTVKNDQERELLETYYKKKAPAKKSGCSSLF